MDYIIRGNAILFDGIIEVLGKHPEDPAATKALDYLKSAKFNYVQRSLDHMLSTSILALHSLLAVPPNEALRRELQAVIWRISIGRKSLAISICLVTGCTR
jgi:hypothetical protein